MLSTMLAIAWARAGQMSESRQALERAAKLAPGGTIRLGGRNYQLADLPKTQPGFFQTRSDRPAFATGSTNGDWPLFRGNPSHTATSAPALPLANPAWSISTLVGDGPALPDSEKIADLNGEIAELETFYRREGNLSTIPTLNPLVVGDLVIYRTLANLQRSIGSAANLPGKRVGWTGLSWNWSMTKRVVCNSIATCIRILRLFDPTNLAGFDLRADQ